jgi:hypothetical protein
MAIMAPSGAPIEMAGLPGKYRRVQGSVPFGGSNGLVCLLAHARRYCPNGGMAFPAQRGDSRGPTIASFRPH